MQKTTTNLVFRLRNNAPVDVGSRVIWHLKWIIMWERTCRMSQTRPHCLRCTSHADTRPKNTSMTESSNFLNPKQSHYRLSAQSPATFALNSDNYKSHQNKHETNTLYFSRETVQLFIMHRLLSI